MKKRYYWILLLFLAIPISVQCTKFPGNPDVTVKCQYKIMSAYYGDGKEDYLTTLNIYVDEKNHKYYLSYTSKNKSERFPGGKPILFLDDYETQEKTGQLLKYVDKGGNENNGFGYFHYLYDNGTNSCPTLYSHFMGGDIHEIYTYEKYNGSASVEKIPVNKKYTSSDGGKTWKEGSNTPSDKVSVISACSYNFLTDHGIGTSEPLILSVKFEKQRNETKKKDIYNIYCE